MGSSPANNRQFNQENDMKKQPSSSHPPVDKTPKSNAPASTGPSSNPPREGIWNE